MRLQPHDRFARLRQLVEPRVQALEAPVKVVHKREPFLLLPPHRLAHLQPEESPAPLAAQEPRTHQQAGAEGQRLKAVLGVCVNLNQLMAVAQEPHHFTTLEQRAVNLWELPPQQQIEDERGILPVVLLPPLRRPPDLGCGADKYPMAESSMSSMNQVPWPLASMPMITSTVKRE